jgi:hypothetical protein
MITTPCVIFDVACGDQRHAGYALRHTQRRIFVDCRIRQSHEADGWQSVAKTNAMGGTAAVSTGALKVIFAATGKRIRRPPIHMQAPLAIS